MARKSKYLINIDTGNPLEVGDEVKKKITGRIGIVSGFIASGGLRIFADKLFVRFDAQEVGDDYYYDSFENIRMT